MENKLEKLWGKFFFFRQTANKHKGTDVQQWQPLKYLHSHDFLCTLMEKCRTSGGKKSTEYNVTHTTFCFHENPSWLSFSNMVEMHFSVVTHAAEVAAQITTHTHLFQQKKSVHVPSLTVSSGGLELSSFLCFIAWSSFFSCRTSFRNSSL